jgi:hypothetical protein
MAVDSPAATVAPGFGWIVGDLTLCPLHAAEGAGRVREAMEAQDAARYGRHSLQNVLDRVSPGAPYVSDAMTFARAYFREQPPTRTGRQFCRESHAVMHPTVTVAELRGAL